MKQYNIAATVPHPLTETITTIPGDKSISHRAVIVGSLSNNTVTFTGFLCAEDCLNTASIFQQLGVDINIDTTTQTLIIKGVGPFGLKPPTSELNVGNSGTGIRLITGLLAAQPFSCTITGDESIQHRPMKRILDPLSDMNVTITGCTYQDKKDIYPPLTIHGNPNLTSLLKSPHATIVDDEQRYIPTVASAQVKSALIFASLYADDPTIIQDKELTRNHTELMLSNCTDNVTLRDDHSILISPFLPEDLVELPSTPITIPADFSSAAFFIVYALVRPNTTLVLKNIGLNPTRSKLIDILIKMGANITISDMINDIEPIGTITVSSSTLTNISIDKNDELPFFIDEIPILSIAALSATGTFTLKDADELRVKESDRIQSTVAMIKAMGGSIQETDSGFSLEGKGSLNVTPHFHVNACKDHRIAMSAIITAKAGCVNASVDDIDCINTSFPNFFSILESL